MGASALHLVPRHLWRPIPGARARQHVGAVDAGFSDALWTFYAKTGIRPEWLVPVLMSESGLNPAAENSIGCVGINQACPFAVPTPDGYTSWPASQQLLQVVMPMYEGIISAYGPIHSGTRAYQANFLPATLATAKKKGDALALEGTPNYDQNRVFDWNNKGWITVDDLAHFIGKFASNSYVKSVLADAYANAPAGVGGMQDPVYGSDFGSLWLKLLGVTVLSAAAGGGAWYYGTRIAA